MKQSITEGCTKRDSYWDSLKFILIFLVVVAHCAQLYKPQGGINQAIFNYDLTVLMPVFIFVSGMFSQMRDREKYKLGILRILETYIVFQIIWTGMKIIPGLMHGTATLKSVIAAILTPQYALWYILSLCFWRLIVLYTPERFLRQNPKRVILACIFISLFGGFIPVGGILSLQRTMTYLPFFFLGYYAKNIEVKAIIAKIPLLLAVGVTLACFLVYYLLLNCNISFILCGKTPYCAVAGYSLIKLFLARGILLISATITGIMLMRLTPTKATAISQWGKLTLFIYIYHFFFVHILRYTIRHGILPQNEWLLILMSVVIMMGLVLLSRVKVLNILLNPISYFKQHKS